MLAFMHKCHAVTELIMSCFAVGLGLNEDYFKEVRELLRGMCNSCMYTSHLLAIVCCIRYATVPLLLRLAHEIQGSSSTQQSCDILRGI